ncbi:hypothetical protein B0H14DRAFT_2174448, partial [Mycena olivaceomarginata]
LHQGSIVLFTCHGIQEPENPLDSGLILGERRQTISELMKTTDDPDQSPILQTMSLAFLSACETAKGGEDIPDQTIHRAATLLFPCFKGVVA